MFACAQDTTVNSCGANISCVAVHKTPLYAFAMDIHSRIRERREALELSKAALGRMLTPEVSYQTIQQWERTGGTMPLRKRIKQLAAALECTVEWLETGYEAPESVVVRPELAELLRVIGRFKKEQIEAVTSFARMIGGAPRNDIQALVAGMVEGHPMGIESVTPRDEVSDPPDHVDKVNRLGGDNLRPKVRVGDIRAKRN